MFNLKRGALDFLQEQISIGIDYSLLVNSLDPRGLREVAGTNNNLVGYNFTTHDPGPYSEYGATDTPFLRLSQVSYRMSGPTEVYRYGVDHTGDTQVTPADNNVTDASPRTISLLVTTGDPNLNPAAAQAIREVYGLGDGDPLPDYTSHDADPLIPNAGVLGGGKYNGWLVAFGQFFDHGLDFINKGGNGTITIPLSSNDPLYNNALPPEQNVMRVSRATLANPDTDFTNGVLNDGVTPLYNNNTAMLIDQSQTYGSDPSVNALLREYTDAGVGTGRVLAGHTELGPQADASDTDYSHGLATWADLKLNAARIGVVLTDADVHNAPVLRVDATGKLLFTPNGTLWTTDPYAGPPDDSDPFMRDAGGNVLRSDQPFLIDINPAADPNFLGIARTEDADAIVNDPAVPDVDPAGGFTYDNELLDAHFIAGDGRINENFMVTAVHNVFHEEHNYQVKNIQNTILAQNDLDVLNQWLVTPVGTVPADPFSLDWDGEKLFQAARMITESEYNHIAIDQYIGALYGALPEFVSYSSDINMGVSLEFSQAVFRLGHSMLNNRISILDPNSDPANPSEMTIGLMDGALNPTGFADYGAAAITLGLVRQTGEEVDEFVSPAIQDTLNGQLLDLGAIDIARGRDVGLPTLNELRDQIYKGLLQYTNNTNGGALAPYQNWADFGDHLRNPGTLTNMLAAYARGGDGGFGDAIANTRAAYEAGTASLDDIRAEAQAVLDAYGSNSDPDHAAAVQFMEGTPTYHSDTKTWTFEGANQGFWDVDLWVGGLAERPLFDGPLGTTFSYILLDFAQRMQDGDRFYYLYRTPMGTDLGDEIIANQFAELVERATGLDHLNADVFIAADKYFYLDDSAKLTNLDNDDDINDYFNAGLVFLDDGVTPASQGHIVVVGGDGDDFEVGGLGDDALYGDAGDDYLQGSQGNDHLYGGDGNDFITDDENDDFIRGGEGDDTIFAGPGAIDTAFGDKGNDEMHGGDGIDELIGGEGDDIIYGDGDTDVLFGSEGNDYLSGGDSVDEIFGGEGNDWLRGGVGDDHLNGGLGRDLLEGGIGPTANDGDRLIGAGGADFPTVIDDTEEDVASYEDVDIAINADLETSNQNGTNGLLDTYVGIEGLVGSRFNDTLTGAGPDSTTGNGPRNLLVGGAGNDVLIGLGGDDEILGDSVVVRNSFFIIDDDSFFDNSYVHTVDHYIGPMVSNWRGTGEARPDFGGNGFGYFLGDNGAAGMADKAVFSGNRSDYVITNEPHGWTRVVDTRGIDSTAFGDLLRDVELLQFADMTITLGAPITDIQWNAIDPGDTIPTAGSEIATLSTTNPGGAPFSYELLAGSDAPFAISADGTVSVSANLPANATVQELTVNLRSTNAFGDFRDETFTVITNNGSSATIDESSSPNDVIIYAGSRQDFITASDHDDTVFGQAGGDVIDGGSGNDVLDGGGGTDRLTGGTGDDTVDGGAGTDTAVFTGTVAGHQYSLDGSGNLVVTDMVGTDGTDTLISIERVVFGTQTLQLRIPASNPDSSNVVNGGGGAQLVLGFGGADTLNGGGGDDVLVGGAGGDTFVFTTTGQADGDIILDLDPTEDAIDVSAIDAQAGVGGNQAFVFIGAGAFSAKGQLRAELVDTDADTILDSTLVQGNINGNFATAEFSILLQNFTGALVEADFIL